MDNEILLESIPNRLLFTSQQRSDGKIESCEFNANVHVCYQRSQVDYVDDIFEASEKGQPKGRMTPERVRKSVADETALIRSHGNIQVCDPLKTITQSGSSVTREHKELNIISIRIETAAERSKFQDEALHTSDI